MMPALTTPAASTPAHLGPARLGPAAWAWALYQGVRDPYVILINIYVFFPYFAVFVVGDAVRGQSVIAEGAKYAGWAVMLIAPLVGATIDRTGRRKPALAFVTAGIALGVAALWFATPIGYPGGLGVVGVMAIFVGITVLFALSETLHNALLLPAAGLRGAGAASGLALAFGNFVSVFMLAFVLWAFALPGKVPWAWVPAAPLFGLDTAAHEHDRITTLIVAGAMVIGSLPLFRFVPDVASTGMRLGAAIRAGVGDLVDLVRQARGASNALIYLGARMIYTDGLTGILLFSGVYGAGRMGWGALELLAYGIILSAVAVIGGLGGGWLDGRIGPKLAVKLELALVIFSQGLTFGMGREELFYQPWPLAEHAPLWDGPMFRTLPEVALLLCSFLTALGVCACYASSRTLMTRVAPPGRTGVFFGLYALAGTATMWLGPMLVEIATDATGSQRLGLLPITGLLVLGLLLMGLVKGGERLRD